MWLMSVVFILRSYVHFTDNVNCVQESSEKPLDYVWDRSGVLHQTDIDNGNESQPIISKSQRENSWSNFTYVSYYYRKTGDHSWAGTLNERNLWIFLCSYKQFLSATPLLMLVGTDVPQEEIDLIESYGATVQLFRILPHLDPRPLPKNVAYEHMTKLIIWSFIEYERLIFLDLDAWPIADLSWLFQLPLPHGQAAVSNPWRQYPVNTGVLLIAPNLTVYGFLMSTYLRGKYTLESHGVAGDQALMRGNIVFDYLPQGANVKWPEFRPQMNPRNVYVLHNLLERKRNFVKYAKRHQWRKLDRYMSLVAQIKKGKCVNLSVFE